jgi:ADP-ribose pyrophosphatase
MRTVEFPAGLIDEGETVEQAALRELREETGYIGEMCRTIPQVSRVVCMSPGVADESVRIVIVAMDLDNPYNQNPKPSTDEGEYVVTKIVPLDSGLPTLLDNGSSIPIEGPYLFAIGLDLG